MLENNGNISILLSGVHEPFECNCPFNFTDFSEREPLHMHDKQMECTKIGAQYNFELFSLVKFLDCNVTLL